MIIYKVFRTRLLFLSEYACHCWYGFWFAWICLWFAADLLVDMLGIRLNSRSKHHVFTRFAIKNIKSDCLMATKINQILKFCHYNIRTTTLMAKRWYERYHWTYKKENLMAIQYHQTQITMYIMAKAKFFLQLDYHQGRTQRRSNGNHSEFLVTTS